MASYACSSIPSHPAKTSVRVSNCSSNSNTGTICTYVDPHFARVAAYAWRLLVRDHVHLQTRGAEVAYSELPACRMAWLGWYVKRKHGLGLVHPRTLSKLCIASEGILAHRLASSVLCTDRLVGKLPVMSGFQGSCERRRWTYLKSPCLGPLRRRSGAARRTLTAPVAHPPPC